MASVPTQTARPATGNWFRYWLPALAWTGVIFFFSTSRFSAEETGDVLRWFIRLVFGHIERPEFAFLHILIRKAAHLTVYAILSLLWFRARRGPRSGWRADWALLAILVSMLVASGDELHQAFLPSRTGTPWDVLLDSLGALLAQSFLLLRAQRKTHSPA